MTLLKNMPNLSDNEARVTLQKLIRNVVDFPKPGIIFRDITPLLSNSKGLDQAIRLMIAPFENQHIDLVVGAESRGFIFGTVIAHVLNCGFVPIRKPGKLPSETLSEEYQLEYGTDTLEIHTDAIQPGQHILMVDDLLATGGTMKACCKMVERLGGQIVGISLLIDLAFLNGRNKLKGYNLNAVITYDQE